MKLQQEMPNCWVIFANFLPQFGARNERKAFSLFLTIRNCVTRTVRVDVRRWFPACVLTFKPQELEKCHNDRPHVQNWEYINFMEHACFVTEGRVSLSNQTGA